MYGEHPNGGMIKVDSRNVEFLKDEFPSIGEIKQDTILYKLPLDDQLPHSEGEDLKTHLVTKDSALLLFGRDNELSVAQENQPENEVRPPSPVHEHEHEHEVSPLVQYNDNDFLSAKDSIPLRDRGKNTLEGQTNIELVLWRSEHGRIPRRYFQI